MLIFYSLVRVQQKITQGADLVIYFCSRDWVFETENVEQLKLTMNEADRNIFPITEENLNDQLIVDNALIVVRKHVLLEKFEDPSGNLLKLNM